MIRKRYIKITSDKEFKVDKFETKSLIADVLKILSLELSFIQVNFINNNNLLKINKLYLGHDYYTDIITFNYSDGKQVDCELFISYECAYSNSQKYHVSYNSEIVRLIIHGILHVAGYDDSTNEKKNVMKKIENRLEKQFSNKFYVIKNGH